MMNLMADPDFRIVCSYLIILVWPNFLHLNSDVFIDFYFIFIYFNKKFEMNWTELNGSYVSLNKMPI